MARGCRKKSSIPDAAAVTGRHNEVLVSVTGVEVPAPVMEPFQIIGAASVPLMLLNYGMSLSGQKILQPGSGRRDVILASTIKLVLMPIAAWAIARFVFGLDGQALFVR